MNARTHRLRTAARMVVDNMPAFDLKNTATR